MKGDMVRVAVHEALQLWERDAFRIGINNHPDNDKKRLFCICNNISCFDWLQILSSFGLGHPNYAVGKVAFIAQLAGCHAQVIHTDYDFKEWDKGIVHVPLAILVALTPRDYVVFPRSHLDIGNQMQCNVHMEPGDIIITRGDVDHGGSSSDKNTLAIHAYIDVPSMKGGIHPKNEVQI